MVREKKWIADEQDHEVKEIPNPARWGKPASRSKYDSAVLMKRTLRTVDEGDEESQEIRDTQTRKLVSEKLDAAKFNAAFGIAFKQQVQDDRASLLDFLGTSVESNRNDGADKKAMRDIISAQIPELDPAIVKLKDIIEVHGDKKLSAGQRRQLDHAKGKAGFHSLTTAASCVLDASRKVLEHYDRLDNQDDKQHVQELLNMRQAWDQDKQAVEDLLRKGKEVTQRRLKRFVPAAMRAANKSSSTVQASDDSQELNSGYFHQHHTADMRLHQAFHQTARGVSRIVRELPKHE